MKRPGLDPELLLVHQDFIRALARALLGADDRAEDVVQETWVVALQNAPKNEGALRAWLRTVVRNLAMTVRRRDATRRRLDYRIASRENSPSTTEIAVREETRRIMVEALLDLEEPYRTVLILRYYEDLPPREVASRLDIPTATARTQLRRGLQRLRRRLEHDGRASGAWQPGILSLAMTRHSAPRWAGFATLIGGVQIMKLKIAMALLAVFAVSILFWRSDDESTAQRTTAGHRDDLARERTNPDLEVASTGSQVTDGASESRPTKTPSSGVAVVRLRGTVRFETPPTQETVRIEVRGLLSGRRSATEVVRGEAAADHTFDLNVAVLFADQTPVELEVLIDHPFYLPLHARTRVRVPKSGQAQPKPLDVLLKRAGVVEGIVQGQYGQPAHNAAVGVFAFRDGAPVRSPTEAVSTGPSGRYRLRVGATGAYLIVAATAKTRPASVRQELRIGSRTEAPTLFLELGAIVAGTLRVNGHAPPSAMFVEAPYPSQGTKLFWQQGLRFVRVIWIDGVVVNQRSRVKVASDGSFRVVGLEIGEYTLRCSAPSGSHADVGRSVNRRIRAPATGIAIDVSICQLAVRVLGKGDPISGARIELTHVRKQGSGRYTSDTDKAGMSRVGVRPGSSYELRVSSAGFKPHKRTIQIPTDRKNVPIIVDLVSAKPRGSLLITFRPHEAGAEMETPPEAAFRLIRLDTSEDDSFPDFDGIQTRRLDTGQFRAEGVQPGRYRLVARPGGGWLGNLSYFQQAVTEFRLTAGEEVSVALDLRIGGRLRIAVRSPDGRALGAACTVRRADGTPLDAWFFRRDGTTLSAGKSLLAGGASEVDQAIPPGRYTIEVSAKGYADLSRDARVVVNRTTVVDLTLAPR